MLQTARSDAAVKSGGEDGKRITADVVRHEAMMVARDLAATAVTRECEGTLPWKELDSIRHTHLLQLLVPWEAGGPGGDWTDAMAVTRIVSAADGSIGQLIGYHYVNVLIAELIGTSTQVARLHRGLLQEAWFIGDSVNPLDPNLSAEQSAGDVVLNGRKTFSTGAAVSDHILIAFTVGEKSRFAIVPREREGIIANDDWDNLGQRLTASGSITFEHVIVKPDEVLGDGLASAAPVPPGGTLVPPLIQSVLVNVHLGLAHGALDAAAAYTRNHSRPWFKSGVSRASEDAYILAEYGRLTAHLSASLALADRVAASLKTVLARGTALTAEERGAVAVESFQSKVESTATALEITARIFELTGARSTALKFGLDRYWRDVRTLSLHDPVIYKAREVGDFIVNGRVPEVSLYS
jgi:alkylation response protein AidB-like acyl-CoA dehydrogenase